MDLYMPSEIARLVLGYLRETGCVQTIAVYLKESPHLCEYVACLKQGVEYPTTIGGQSLIELIRELCTKKASSGQAGSSMPTPAGQSFTEVKSILERLERSVSQLKSLAATTGCLRTRNVQIQTESDELLQVAVSPVSSVVGLLASTSSPTSLQICGELEIVSNDIPTIRIEEASSSGAPYEDSIVSVDNRDQSLSRSAATLDMMASTDIFYCSSRSGGTHTTPTSRQLNIYSSPTSIARSALIFSLGIEALQTPVKEIDDVNAKSPRRKNWASTRRELDLIDVHLLSQLPRKRLTYTPTSSSKKKNQQMGTSLAPLAAAATTDTDVVPTEDSVDVSELFGQLLNSTALHECIAANINRVVCSSSTGETQCTRSGNRTDEVQSSPAVTLTVPAESVETVTVNSDALPKADASSSEHLVPDNVVKDIVDRTESDPLFEAFINIFFDKHDVNTLDSEQSETASPDTHGTPLSEAMLSAPTSHRGTPLEAIVTNDTVIAEPKSSIACAIEVDQPANVSDGSTEPVITTDHHAPVTLLSLAAAPSCTQAPSDVATFVDVQSELVGNPSLVLPHIVVNDLQLETSVITTDGGGCNAGMTKTMTFTVIETPNDATPAAAASRLQEIKEPCQLAFSTLSHSQFQSLIGNGRQLHSNVIFNQGPVELTTSSLEKSRTVSPNRDAVEMALKAVKKHPPRRNIFARKKPDSILQSASGGDDQRISSVCVDTDVTHFGGGGGKSTKGPKQVCAVPLKFTDPSQAMYLLEPKSRPKTVTTTMTTTTAAKMVPPPTNTNVPIIVEIEEPTKSKEIRSPQLCSLLSQSAQVLNHRGVTSLDNSHVRVLNFGAQSDCGGTLARGTSSVLKSTPVANTGDKVISLRDAPARTVTSGSHPKSTPGMNAKSKTPNETRRPALPDKRIRKRKVQLEPSKDANHKRPKTGTTRNTLSTMDVEKFLATVQYVE